MANFLSGFIPTNVVTAMVNETLKKDLVFGNLIMNPTIPGQLTPGASYKIPSVGSITVNNYTGADIDLQDVTDSSIALTVDQQKYFNINVDKVDSMQQAKSLLPLFTAEAAYELASTEDTYIAATLSAGAAINNASIFGAAAAQALDETNIIEWIGEVKTAYDKANVSKAGRFLVLPPFAETALASANVVTAATVAEAARTTGYLRNFFGFDLYMSNSLPVDTEEYQAIAGINRSGAIIHSVQEIEFYKPEKRFSAAAKGLNVYGAKVLRADATASLKISKA